MGYHGVIAPALGLLRQSPAVELRGQVCAPAPEGPVPQVHRTGTRLKEATLAHHQSRAVIHKDELLLEGGLGLRDLDMENRCLSSVLASLTTR